MQIISQGLACFQLIGKHLSREVVVVIDPYDNSVGLRFPKTEVADLVLVSHDAPEANNVAAVEGKPFVVDMPGEFEVADIFVYSIVAPRKGGVMHRIFRIEIEGLSIAFLGALDRKLKSPEIEALGDIDILFVPIGDGMVLGSEDAVEVVQSVDPRIVFPMFFGDTKLDIKEKDAKKFLKDVGVPVKNEGSKYKITKAQLPVDVMDVVVIQKD